MKNSWIFLFLNFQTIKMNNSRCSNMKIYKFIPPEYQKIYNWWKLFKPFNMVFTENLFLLRGRGILAKFENFAFSELFYSNGSISETIGRKMVKVYIFWKLYSIWWLFDCKWKGNKNIRHQRLVVKLLRYEKLKIPQLFPDFLFLSLISQLSPDTSNHFSFSWHSLISRTVSTLIF